MAGNELKGPHIVSSKLMMGVNDQGVMTTVMYVRTKLALFDTDPDFDRGALNKLLSAVSVWQNANFPMQVHIVRESDEVDDA